MAGLTNKAVLGEMAIWRAKLMDTCVSSLEMFYMPDHGIFSQSVSWDGTQLQKAEPSPRNTAIILQALFVFRNKIDSVSVKPETILDQLVNHHSSEFDYPETALTLWADALGDNQYGRHLDSKLESCISKGASQTLYLAWTLSALCNYFSFTEKSERVAAMAAKTYRKIAENQISRSGLFYNSAARNGLFRRKSSSASFASQVWAIQAFALYGKIFNKPEALERAQRCADKLCDLQGPLGQWWWIYDVRKGSVVERYPVYTVNQDAAAPLAFGELDRALNSSRYTDAIGHGMAWVFGNNELQQSLLDEKLGLIWRGVAFDANEFSVIQEMYSYHPARCLLALNAMDKL